jgi:hypothetical protein
MILRRVIKHFRNQEWTAIFLDFLIVVIGVFMGFQVTGWAGERENRSAEVRHLEEIAEDIRADIEIFKVIRHAALARISATNYILHTARGEKTPTQITLSIREFDLPAGPLVGKEDETRLLGMVNLVRTTYGNRTGFEALIGSGHLNLIRNRKISRNIQRYYAAYEDLWSTQSMVREIRNDGVSMSYALGLSAFGEVEAGRVVDVARDSEAYASYLKTLREWAAIHLSIIETQLAAAEQLQAAIEAYLVEVER